MNKGTNIDFLIKELNKGNVQAFDEIYKLYSQRVYLFALSIAEDSTDAEDVVQEVFIKIWEKRFDLTTTGSFASLLFTITKNSLLNNIRKSNTHLAFIEYKKQNTASSNSNLEDEIHGRELESIYQKAIDCLSPRKREVFILYNKEHLSYIEIAEKLGISPKTVRNQVDNATSEIREFISKMGFTGMLALSLFSDFSIFYL